MSPLPYASYDLFYFTKRKVHPDCHLQHNKNYYSVPYKFVGREVDVKFNSKMVYVYWNCELVALQFVKNRENIIFLGGTGVGKSFLAQAIGQEACAQGVEVFFIAANRLFKELEVAETQGTYLTYMNRLRKKVELLIIDDFGLRNYSHQEAQ